MPKLSTPFGRFLAYTERKQVVLAPEVGLSVKSLNRIVKHGMCSPKMAVRLMAALPDAGKLGFDERHILLPTTEPYASWVPPLP